VKFFACFYLYFCLLLFMDDKALFVRLDKMIELLEASAKQPTLAAKVINGAATGAGILGLFSVVDVIKSWIGG
jgi:hypothetical protein